VTAVGPRVYVVGGNADCGAAAPAPTDEVLAWTE
jgi:hypothetical protein